MDKQTQMSDIQRALGKLQPGKLPFDLFTQVARLVVTPVVEIVPLKRHDNGKMSVVLFKRPSTDPQWAGMFHVPGAIILPSDGDIDGSIERIISSKLDMIQPGTPRFVKVAICHSARGTELAIVYWVEICSDAPANNMYDVDNLPSDLIEGHGAFIEAAVALFHK